MVFRGEKATTTAGPGQTLEPLLLRCILDRGALPALFQEGLPFCTASSRKVSKHFCQPVPTERSSLIPCGMLSGYLPQKEGAGMGYLPKVTPPHGRDRSCLLASNHPSLQLSRHCPQTTRLGRERNSTQRLWNGVLRQEGS